MNKSKLMKEKQLSLRLYNSNLCQLKDSRVNQSIKLCVVHASHHPALIAPRDKSLFGKKCSKNEDTFFSSRLAVIALWHDPYVNESEKKEVLETMLYKIESDS